MVREYRSLFITDELQKAYEAKAAGRYVVLALPLSDNASYDMEDFPYAIENLDEIPDTYLDRLILRFAGKPWTILETARCRLREITVEDVDALYEIYADPSVTAYMENLYADPEEERAYTRDYIKNHYGFFEFGMWIIEDRQTGRIIGRAGLDMVAEKENPQLGFVVRKEYQRKGYAFEVCRAILAYAHEELGFPVVEASCDADNVASINILCKLCFLRDEKGVEFGNTTKNEQKVCVFWHEQKRASEADKCYTIV